MSAEIAIPARFCGPDESANGGWACGLIAEQMSTTAGELVEVTLRRPPPLDTSMQLRPADDGPERDRYLVHDGDLVAEATVTRDGVDPPPSVDLPTAELAASRYGGLHHHPFPHCFGCGTAREPGDGLRVFAGPVDGQVLGVAAPVRPPADLVDADGHVRAPAVWAVLDCPTFWPYHAQGLVAVLGRMRAEIHRPIAADGVYVVVGRGEGGEGRKRRGSSALYTPDGDLVAAATTTWLTTDR